MPITLSQLLKEESDEEFLTRIKANPHNMSSEDVKRLILISKDVSLEEPEKEEQVGPIAGDSEKVDIIKVYTNDDPNDTRGDWYCPRCFRQVNSPGRYRYCRACSMGLDYNKDNFWYGYLKSRNAL